MNIEANCKELICKTRVYYSYLFPPNFPWELHFSIRPVTSLATAGRQDLIFIGVDSSSYHNIK
jgi:hypothetical protein